MSRQADSDILDRRFGLGKAASVTMSGGSVQVLPPAEQLRFPDAAMVPGEALPSLEAMCRELFQLWADTKAGGTYKAPQGLPGLPERKPDEKPFQYYYRMEVGLRLRHGIETRHPFLERLVLFWSNHFALSARSHPKIRMLAGHFERTVIRPNILGSFSELLRQAVHHPAYLTYFDAESSTGPHSRHHGKFGEGYNENIGREIMELHTLGDTSLYSLEDVQSLSLMLTGWGHAYLKDPSPGAFVFRKTFHEPGTQKLLGKPYKDAGVHQAETALADLARHPATALHLSRKLIRYFSGAPAREDQAKHLARVYLENDTKLLPVMRELLAIAPKWDPEPRAITTPYEFLIGSLRAVGPDAVDFGRMMHFLDASGQETWNPPNPEGWPDDAEMWLSAEGVSERLKWAAYVASKAPGNRSPHDLARELLGASYGGELQELLDRTPSREQAIVLILMSPSVQRR